jgi:hypothetical protein
MTRRFENYRMSDGRTRLGEAYFNAVFRDLDLRLHGQESLDKEFQSAIDQLNRFGLRRIDDFLRPALLEIEEQSEFGFLTATIQDDAPVTFNLGVQAVIILEGGQRSQFRPSPFIAFQAAADPDIYAVARTIGYDRPSGVLDLEFVSRSTGAGSDPGPHTGISLAVMPGGYEAVRLLVDAAQAAAVDADTNAGLAAGSAFAAAVTAGAKAHIPGAAYAVKAAAISNVDSQTYRARGALSGVITDPAADGDNWERITFGGAYADLSGKPSLFSGAYADLSGKPSVATAAQVKALTGSGSMTPEKVATALLASTPSGSADWTPVWGGFIAADWVLTGNRALLDPDDVIPGTTRSVTLSSNAATARSITFGPNFKGDLPDVEVTNAAFVTLFLHAVSATQILVSDKEWA